MHGNMNINLGWTVYSHGTITEWKLSISNFRDFCHLKHF